MAGKRSQGPFISKHGNVLTPGALHFYFFSLGGFSVAFHHDGMEKGLVVSRLKVQAGALSVFLERSQDPLIVGFCRALARARLYFFSRRDLSVVLQGLTKRPFEHPRRRHN